MESVTLRQVSQVGQICCNDAERLQRERQVEQELVNNMTEVDVMKGEEVSNEERSTKTPNLEKKYTTITTTATVGQPTSAAALSSSSRVISNVVKEPHERETVPRMREVPCAMTNKDFNTQRTTLTPQTNMTDKTLQKKEQQLVNTNTTPEPSHVPGSRYAQLKAIAEREHVSLTEARRMMSENVRKLQERGDKIGAIESKSNELAQQALTFQELARQLKEKQRNS